MNCIQAFFEGKLIDDSYELRNFGCQLSIAIN